MVQYIDRSEFLKIKIEYLDPNLISELERDSKGDLELLLLLRDTVSNNGVNSYTLSRTGAKAVFALK